MKGNYQNSSKLILPLLSTSNIRIIILTVCKSKLVKSPFTSAFPSSLSVSCPVPLLSTALNNGNREASALLLLAPGAGVGGGRDGRGGRPWCACGGGLKP